MSLEKIYFPETDKNYKRVCSRLISSLKYFDIPYEILCESEPFGLHIKYKWLYNRLINSDEKYFMMCDSRDVIFMDRLDNIFNKYKEYDCKLLLQAESTGEYLSRRHEDFTAKNRYKFTNSGLVIGEVKYFIDYIYPEYEKHMLGGYEYSDNDQLIMDEIYLSGDFLDFKLDINCNLFQEVGCCNNGTSCNFDLHYNFKDLSIHNLHTNTTPSVFHGAGNTILNSVEKILNLKKMKKNNFFY